MLHWIPKFGELDFRVTMLKEVSQRMVHAEPLRILIAFQNEMEGAYMVILIQGDVAGDPTFPKPNKRTCRRLFDLDGDSSSQE